ncbi:MAG: hypothetical protein WBA43_15455 [Elainellaceae cyanobacterium]
MSQDNESVDSLKARIEALTQENESLKQQLAIDDLAKENEDLRRKVAIEEMVCESRSRLFKGVLAILGSAGLATFVGVWSLYSQLEARVTGEDTINRIQSQVTKQAYETMEQQVLDNVFKGLVTTFQDDSEFRDDLLAAFSEQVIKDPAFMAQVRDEATRVTDTIVVSTFENVAQQNPNSSFATATDQILNQRRYYVVTASSTVPEDLNVPKDMALERQLTARICPPKEGNRRSVLLITDQNDLALSIDDARRLEAIAQGIEATAYILPSEPETGVFFDPAQCR